jgi:hypothetical protein
VEEVGIGGGADLLDRAAVVGSEQLEQRRLGAASLDEAVPGRPPEPRLPGRREDPVDLRPGPELVDDHQVAELGAEDRTLRRTWLAGRIEATLQQCPEAGVEPGIGSPR